MISVENFTLRDAWLRFDVRITDEDTGKLKLRVRGCSVSKGHLNGPSVRAGSSWIPVVEFHGEVKSAILEALAQHRAQYPDVQWPAGG